MVWIGSLAATSATKSRSRPGVTALSTRAAARSPIRAARRRTTRGVKPALTRAR
ncbi:hypothetical protein ABT264_32865 [Streptomyces virginiae]|uniref:hypothetical protein n=1 Tax=Streptomyces virginiae TaxID=1961 RepID=UPI00332C7575